MLGEDSDLRSGVVKSNTTATDELLEQEGSEEVDGETLKRSLDKPTISSILYNATSINDSDVLTPGNLADIDDEESKPNLTLSPRPSTPVATTSTIKRKDDDELTPPVKPAKKSRKLQGAGVKKPLYTRYESIFIIKAFKTITDKIPNLVLIDLFKIIAILFNGEANRQGFKERTSDQLYQKYKRIQHGLNHGEVEFTDFFERNKYNPKEWIPNFIKVEKTDEILKYIKFHKLDDAVKEILGSSIANLKPPLPDSYEGEPTTEIEEETFNEKTKLQATEQPTNYSAIKKQQEEYQANLAKQIKLHTKLIQTKVPNDEIPATEDELLKLAGFEDSEPAISAAAAALASLDPSNSKASSSSNITNTSTTSAKLHKQEQQSSNQTTEISVIASTNTDGTTAVDLRQKLHLAHQEIHRQKDVIRLLEQNAILKNQECQFLKSMIKEDLSYIRHKLNEQSNIATNYHSTSNSLASYHHNFPGILPVYTNNGSNNNNSSSSSSSNNNTSTVSQRHHHSSSTAPHLPALHEGRVSSSHSQNLSSYSPTFPIHATLANLATAPNLSSAKMSMAASTSVILNHTPANDLSNGSHGGSDGPLYQHRHSTDHAGLQQPMFINSDTSLKTDDQAKQL